ncbi:hydroxyacyl-thioester dehydratase type 2, mitochondrial-like [Diorhabda sublineata]|uniref:hydroxyacyl-thioester dehydratase type 2, mitochondrial-like n=1 Tax=Diorhabda sublineata TaxID=1163346 RepID=UPI0024E15740|nr:hydroxyacyl-thioester dehydratase type 2, mitochondrial-like [Diorhabda sublineata]
MNIYQIIRRSSNLAAKKYYVGQEASITRKIRKEDVDNFALLSGDSNPIHSTITSQAAVVHGALLNSIVSGVIGTRLPGFGAVVVQQTLHFPNKCYVDETVKVTIKLVENRKIMKVEFSCSVTDSDKVVLFGTAKLVMNK